ncbi:DUF6894 family protein [Brevundimonas lutea]|uniref:DUF6894 family protein n=1 Tax=Brevundimonas lutea TaxID=2293980 RepID=UPI000F02CFC3|nr:hypothetical protein [Brevundimonas lutea]
MPRYFFDLPDGSLLTDEVGEMLSDDDAARRSAQRLLSELVESRSELWRDGRFSVEVFDADRMLVGRLVVQAETAG